MATANYKRLRNISLKFRTIKLHVYMLELFNSKIITSPSKKTCYPIVEGVTGAI